MRLRFRTLILTVALLLTSTPSMANLLDPFHWHNYNQGYGAYPVNDPAYAHHYGTYRLIDDWLGYGYLRNQEGTYGHYPFRGWNWGGLGGGSNWKGGWDLGLFGWNWDWGWGLNPGGVGWNYNWGGRLGWPQGGNGSQFYQPSYQGLLNPCPPIAPVYPHHDAAADRAGSANAVCSTNADGRSLLRSMYGLLRSLHGHATDACSRSDLASRCCGSRSLAASVGSSSGHHDGSSDAVHDASGTDDADDEFRLR